MASVPTESASGPVRAVDLDEVIAAAGRIQGHVRRTPLVTIDGGSLGIDSDVVCKLETLQPTGSFKVRGATSLLTARDVPAAGVAAASGGNFGLAIAWAAARLGHRARVFVPATSPPEKIDPIRQLGAEVEVVDGYYADALHASHAYVEATGALAAHAYDQREVVAGQGTATLELVADEDVDTLLVACGGGGLLAGAVAATAGRVRIIAVETTATATLASARAAGGPVDVEVGGVAASALGARRIGELAWAAQPQVDAALLVEDADVVEAQRRLWSAARLVTEPAGAAALAALTCGAYRPEPDERVAVLVCGANTNPADVV